MQSADTSRDYLHHLELVPTSLDNSRTLASLGDPGLQVCPVSLEPNCVCTRGTIVRHRLRGADLETAA